MNKEPLKNLNELENALETIYQAPEPSAEFLNNLESQLEQSHHQTIPQSARPSYQNPRNFRWAAIPAVIVLTLTLFVAAIGPQQVLAQVQALIGYVPGVGFVDINDVRILTSPVSQTQDGITVTIKQVMAGPDQTYLVMSVDGLEPTHELLADYWAQPPEQPTEEWLARYRSLWDSDGRLILPNSSEVFSEDYQGSPHDGYYTMPILPADVLSATFKVTRLPGVPADKAPQDWSFELEFGYAATAPATPQVSDSGYTADSIPTFNETESDAPSIALPEASPVDTTSETSQGISLRALDVVYAETETTIRLKIENIPLDWHYRQIHLYGTLTDDLGNEYTSVLGPNSGFQPDSTYILSFDPILPQASELSLTINDFTIILLMDDLSIPVDFGESPQVGDAIPLDSEIEIFGTHLHFNTINIRASDPNSTMSDGTPLTWLDFYLDPIHAEGDLVISGIMFTEKASEALGISESSRVGGGGGGGGGGGDSQESNYYFYPSIGFPGDLPLPTGSYELPIDEVQLNIRGPFVVEWDVPVQ